MMMRYLDEAVETCENLLPQSDLNAEASAAQPLNDYHSSAQSWTQACQTVGNILAGMGFVEESYPWRSMALDAEPNSAKFYAESGRIYSQCEVWDKAIYFCQRTLDYQPDSVRTRRLLAKIYNQMGNYRLESQTLNELLTLQPEKATPEGHYQLGQVMTKQGQIEAAVRCYRRAIAQDAKYAAAYYALCELWAQQQQWDEAVMLLEQLIEKLSVEDESSDASDLATAHYRLGRVYRQSKQVEKAIEQFRQALRLNSHLHWAYMGLLNSLMQMQRWDEVIAPCQKLTHRAEEFPWIYTFMANALAAKGELQEAAIAHQKAFALRGWTACSERGYTFKRTWFAQNIPIWEQHLAEAVQQPAVRDPLRILSLGCQDAAALCWLIDCVLVQPEDRLLCLSQQSSEQLNQNVTDNIARLSELEKFAYAEGDILQTLTEKIPQSEVFTAVVIQDKRKDASYIQSLASQAWERLKPGGILFIKDCHWRHPSDPNQSAQAGIDAFVSSAGDRAEVLHRSHEIIIRKIAMRTHQTENASQEIPNA